MENQKELTEAAINMQIADLKRDLEKWSTVEAALLPLLSGPERPVSEEINNALTVMGFEGRPTLEAKVEAIREYRAGQEAIMAQLEKRLGATRKKKTA